MIRNSFNQGPEGWCSYDYHWSIVAGGRNIFILTTWESSGGVRDSGYVWCDHTRWSADTPETPVSVLPFIMYVNWVGREPMDLGGARVSVYLRGDGLKLNGAKCFFWVVGTGGRWHLFSQPLRISEGAWDPEPNAITLSNDPSQWHRSWSTDPSNPPALDTILGRAASYGFSLVGFAQEPRGRFSMDEFEIRIPDSHKTDADAPAATGS